ncbi:hypothetical protein D5086_021384 [Populus alba]|uniref:Uncharacterized protein n=1 Tax=Populus alba TaxID=43335 RepID=A0ACC4BCL4_POPAL
MELDETDPAIWLKLKAAVDDYVQNNSEAFKNVCERLTFPYQHDDKLSEIMKSQQFSKAKVSNADETSPSLGWRRNVLLVEALHSPGSGRAVQHSRALETFCSRNAIRLSLMHATSGIARTVPPGTFPSPFSSPLITGSFPSSPLLFSPDLGSQRIGLIDSVPPLSLDGVQSGKIALSPPMSPSKHRQLSLPVRSLHEKLQNSPQVGIIHLALQNDSSGSILSWQNDVFVVAEPGDLADKFLQSVKFSLLSMNRNRHRKIPSLVGNISTVADLVHCKPCFLVENVIHRYIGRQTQVMEDDQEIGAYMFRRTVPSMHLTPEDVRWMVGAWRDRIIICTGAHGPMPTLIKAFLDSGAKAVICPSVEPLEIPVTLVHGSGEYNVLENGRFEIGEEEAEPTSPVSDWEDSDPEKNGDHSIGFWDDDEEELSQFVCKLYDLLFRVGARVDVALQNALAVHQRLSLVSETQTSTLDLLTGALTSEAFQWILIITVVNNRG